MKDIVLTKVVQEQSDFTIWETSFRIIHTFIVNSNYRYRRGFLMVKAVKWVLPSFVT